MGATIDNNKWTTFFGSYNQAIAIAFEEAMENFSIQEQFNSQAGFVKIKELAHEKIENWYNLPLNDLNGSTPRDTIDQINNENKAAKILMLAFEECDDDIPSLLSEKLKSFGPTLNEELSKIVLSPSWEQIKDNYDIPTDSIYRSNGALKLLMHWGDKDALTDVVKKLSATTNPNEFMIETIKEYLVNFSDDSINIIAKELNHICEEKMQFNPSHEYLLVSLVLASKNKKEDRTFACIHKCFNYMDNKVIGAICVGDYNDIRGITLLKEYLNSNEDKVKRDEFYEILSSIKRMGGQTHDIKDPFKDFSK